jgi:hypothetical protein
MCRQSHNPSHNPAQVSLYLYNLFHLAPHSPQPSFDDLSIIARPPLDHLSTTARPPLDHLLTSARSRLDDLSTHLYAELIPPLLNLLKVVFSSSNTGEKKPIANTESNKVGSAEMTSPFPAMLPTATHWLEWRVVSP